MNERDVASALSRVLRAHGGGLELLAAGPDAEVRFTGMCAGCAGRPLCLRNLVARRLGCQIHDRAAGARAG